MVGLDPVAVAEKVGYLAVALYPDSYLHVVFIHKLCLKRARGFDLVAVVGGYDGNARAERFFLNFANSLICFAVVDKRLFGKKMEKLIPDGKENVSVKRENKLFVRDGKELAVDFEELVPVFVHRGRAALKTHYFVFNVNEHFLSSLLCERNNTDERNDRDRYEHLYKFQKLSSLKRSRIDKANVFRFDHVVAA